MSGFVMGALFTLGCIYLNGFLFIAMLGLYSLLFLVWVALSIHPGQVR